jgi:hypothetical protein
VAAGGIPESAREPSPVYPAGRVSTPGDPQSELEFLLRVPKCLLEVNNLSHYKTPRHPNSQRTAYLRVWGCLEVFCGTGLGSASAVPVFGEAV